MTRIKRGTFRNGPLCLTGTLCLVSLTLFFTLFELPIVVDGCVRTAPPPAPATTRAINNAPGTNRNGHHQQQQHQGSSSESFSSSGSSSSESRVVSPASTAASSNKAKSSEKANHNKKNQHQLQQQQRSSESSSGSTSSESREVSPAAAVLSKTQPSEKAKKNKKTQQHQQQQHQRPNASSASSAGSSRDSSSVNAFSEEAQSSEQKTKKMLRKKEKESKQQSKQQRPNQEHLTKKELDRALNALGFPSERECSTSAHPRHQFSEKRFFDQILSSSGNHDQKQLCAKIKKRLAFPTRAMSEEERNFPLAYAMVVHESIAQVYLELSAFYQPQNLYCMAVDEGATQEFKQAMRLLGKCFPHNLHVMEVEKVEWAKFSVVNAVFSCYRWLAASRHPWRYVQYLSDKDLPLKTNLEMERIFHRLNGTINAEVSKTKEAKFPPGLRPPLPLWKSSLSALLPRAAVNDIVRSHIVHEHLEFLRKLSFSEIHEVPDELLWATIAGNPKFLHIHGGFNAREVFEEIQRERAVLRKHPSHHPKHKRTLEEPFVPDNYYISRWQLWEEMVVPGDDATHCHGSWVKWSCSFGMGDVRHLERHAELVAHKISLSKNPDAFLCLYRAVRARAFDTKGQEAFEGNRYSFLPQVVLTRHPGWKPSNVRYLDLNRD